MEQEKADVTHNEDEYLEAIREKEPASTKEIAELVGVTRQGADYRLRQLEDDGLVKSKKIGNSLAWSVVNSDDRT